MNYRFKPNKRAEEATLDEQMRKVIEEACEAYDANMKRESDARIAEELLDTIWACEGALRKLSQASVVVAEDRFMLKARERGDL